MLAKLRGWIVSLSLLDCCWLTVKGSTAEVVVSLRLKRSGKTSFCDCRLRFCKFFLSEYFASVLESAVLSMLFGVNKLAVLIPILRGFSLLPIKNFDNIVSVL